MPAQGGTPNAPGAAHLPVRFDGLFLRRARMVRAPGSAGLFGTSRTGHFPISPSLALTAFAPTYFAIDCGKSHTICAEPQLSYLKEQYMRYATHSIVGLVAVAASMLTFYSVLYA